MSQRFKVKLSKKEFDDAIIPINYVAVELLQVEEDKKTKSGILVGFNPDDTWGTMEGTDGDTHPADVAEVVGKVVKLPQKLYFNEDGSGMPWDTDMELQRGDTAWFNFMESLNAIELNVDGMIVRIIPYSDIYVAKRLGKIWRGVGGATGEEIIVCLNGYCLLERIKYPKLSDLDVVSENHYYDDRGIVRFIGSANKKYTSRDQVDDINVEVGQTAYLKSGYKPFLLERNENLGVFDNGKMYYCVQRRRIMFVV